MKLQISVSAAASQVSELHDYVTGALSDEASASIKSALGASVRGRTLDVADDGNGNSCVYLESGKRTYYFVQASDSESSKIFATLARAYPSVKKAKGIVVFSAPSNKVLSQILPAMTASTVQFNGEYKSYIAAITAATSKADSASVSAASPLTPLGKQVRALESQAAKARKLFDSAKDAEAAGKSIDVKLARLQEVLGPNVASAPSGTRSAKAPAVQPARAPSAAQKGLYVFLAEHVRMSDRLVHHEWVRVRSVADAGKKARAYIRDNGLGNSTWMGGLVAEDGKVIGCVDYNGKFEDVTHPDTKMYVSRYATKFLNLLKKQMSSTSAAADKYLESRWVYLAKDGKVGAWKEARNSLDQAGVIVRNYVKAEGLDATSFTGGLLIEDGDIVGRITPAGKFVHIENDHAGMKAYMKRAGDAAMGLLG